MILFCLFYIIGGDPVESDDKVALSTVAIMYKGVDDQLVSNCTGTLISSDLVLTAAHCVVDVPLDSIYISFSLKVPNIKDLLDGDLYILVSFV